MRRSVADNTHFILCTYVLANLPRLDIGPVPNIHCSKQQLQAEAQWIKT